MPMKAYQVDGYDDTGSVIVFAERSVVARREGARELGIEFESVRGCMRAPEWDGYAELGYVPAEELIRSGRWWISCEGCERSVDEYAEGDEEDGYAPLEPVYEGRVVWCSAKCREAECRRRARQKRSTLAIPRYLRRKFPGAELATHSASVWRASGGRRVAYVTFSFPGSLGTVDMTIRDSEHRAGDGRKPGSLYVQKRDLKAWYDFIGKPELFREEEAA